MAGGRRALLLAAALVMVTSMVAVPTAAGSPVPADTGVINNSYPLTVGKSGHCNRDGTGEVSGGGLGLPLLNDKKDAIYVFENALTMSVSLGRGWMDLCGWLTDVFGLGASCDMSKGYNGQGEIEFPNGTILYIKDLQWKASAGTIYLIIGNVATTKAKAKAQEGGKIFALGRMGANMSGPRGIDCLSKGDNEPKSAGLSELTTTWVYGITPWVQGAPKPNDMPGTCKYGEQYITVVPGMYDAKIGEGTCLYHSKPPTSP